MVVAAVAVVIAVADADDDHDDHGEEEEENDDEDDDDDDDCCCCCRWSGHQQALFGPSHPALEAARKAQGTHRSTSTARLIVAKRPQPSSHLNSALKVEPIKRFDDDEHELGSPGCRPLWPGILHVLPQRCRRRDCLRGHRPVAQS